jgi:hypothetical protein
VLRLFSILLVALALVVAGCGGGDDEAGGDTTATVTGTTDTTDESTTEETTTDATSEDTDDGVSGFPSGDCLEAVTAFGVLAQAAAAASGVDADESLQSFQEFADNAPDEIQDDLEVLTSAYAEYIQTLSELGLEQGEVPDADQIAELTRASEAFNTSEFQAASENWDAWLATNCPTG